MGRNKKYYYTRKDTGITMNKLNKKIVYNAYAAAKKDHTSCVLLLNIILAWYLPRRRKGTYFTTYIISIQQTPRFLYRQLNAKLSNVNDERGYDAFSSYYIIQINASTYTALIHNIIYYYYYCVI